MKHLFKQLLCIWLCLTMVLSCFPVFTVAASAEDENIPDAPAGQNETSDAPAENPEPSEEPGNIPNDEEYGNVTNDSGSGNAPDDAPAEEPDQGSSDEPGTGSDDSSGSGSTPADQTPPASDTPPAEDPEATGASEEENTPILYSIKVEGIPVTSTNAADILGDGTAAYNPDTNTLTLSNADISVGTGNYGIRAEGDLNIRLQGENSISSEDYYGIAIVAAADGTLANVSIQGDGSLDAYGNDAGILVRGSLTVSGQADVTARSGEVQSGRAFGLRVNDDLLICEQASVTGIAGSAPGNSYGVYAADEFTVTGQAALTGIAGPSSEYSYGIASDDNFTVSGSAEVTAEAGNGIGRSCGLYVISNIYLQDDATITSRGIDTSESSDFASESYGIRTTHMYISGGTLTSAGDGASGISAGIFTQDMTISGGTVNAVSTNAKAGQSVGLQATKTLSLSGGTLNAAGTDTSADSWAIDAGDAGVVTITGGTIHAVTGTGDNTWGLNADTLSISGGTVTVEAKTAQGMCRGIRSINDCSISGGSITVTAGDAERQSYGIQTSGVLEITGGEVTVSRGTAGRGSALYAAGAIRIMDADVDVISGGNGIYAPYGTIDFSCSDVTVSQDGTALLGTAVRVDAVGYGVWGLNGVTISENLTISTPEKGKISESSPESGESFAFISAENGTAAEAVVIEPRGYLVTIAGLASGVQVLIPAGKSVNEIYADFSESIDTRKPGYVFAGFYADEGCTNAYSFDSAVTEDTTVYTKWNYEIGADVRKIEEDAAAFDAGSVKSSDIPALQQLLEEISALLADTGTNPDEKAILEDAQSHIESLLAVIDAAAAAPHTEATEKVRNITSQNVRRSNQEDLEAARDDLKKALKDYSGNLTEEEKKDIQAELDRIEGALNVLGNVQSVEDLIDALPAKITKDDIDAVRAAEKAYNALSAGEKPMIPLSAKVKLNTAILAANRLSRPASSDNPKTGDAMDLPAITLLMSGSLTALFVLILRRKYLF